MLTPDQIAQKTNDVFYDVAPSLRSFARTIPGLNRFSTHSLEWIGNSDLEKFPLNLKFRVMGIDGPAGSTAYISYFYTEWDGKTTPVWHLDLDVYDQQSEDCVIEAIETLGKNANCQQIPIKACQLLEQKKYPHYLLDGPEKVQAAIDRLIESQTINSSPDPWVAWTVAK